ncbi:MAG: hypothetical protein V1644_00525, partial [Candidatus Micrarchaeota archaeon]
MAVKRSEIETLHEELRGHLEAHKHFKPSEQKFWRERSKPLSVFDLSCVIGPSFSQIAVHETGQHIATLDINDPRHARAVI